MPDSTKAVTQEPIHLFVEASFADAPEWIPLLPTPGIYPHPTYGNVDLSTEAIDRYVDNFNAGVYGQKHIPVDLEHDLPLSGAMGYMTELRKNDNGSVDARVDWNDRGKQVLAEERFKYVSPTLRDTWSDPVSMTPHRNVAVGVALTTRPWFKESSLRPLITASEPIPAGQRQEASPMSETTGKTPEQEGADIVAKSFGEKYADLERQFSSYKTDAEAQAKAFADRLSATEAENKTLREDKERREFREKLAGVNDVDTHIDMLLALPDDKRETYIKTQVDSAKSFAELRKQALGAEIGSDAAGEAKGEGYAALDAKARALMAEKPGMKFEQAFSEVARLNPDDYRAARQRN